jgi:FKBP-type peptidyl-prolyl cis-trans isomerase (trigger factor)
MGQESETGIRQKTREEKEEMAEMKDVESKSKVDIEAVIEQIWNDLNGTTSYSEIRRVITEVAPLYEDVRITTYVPIFLRRDVLQRLQG